MKTFFKYQDLQLNEPSYAGHEVYLHALHHRDGKAVSVVAKKNKHNRPFASQLEVAFSRLARLFMAPNLTPRQHLVVDDNQAIWGTAVDNVYYDIEKREPSSQTYYQFVDLNLVPVRVHQLSDIPIHFFDKLPQGFFAKLTQDQRLSIDYQSLANIMATSYTLEEDDLHKANFGFYLVAQQDKVQVKFFKIDHDLMFIDSIMSFCSTRFFHWAQAEHAFDITARDLLDFPNLRDSSNAYWPTKKSKIRRPNQQKEYLSDEDISAFKALSGIEAFNKAKWQAFYKHIRLPESIIRQSLASCFDMSKACERAKMMMVLQAMIARQARLKAVLFSLPEFRAEIPTSYSNRYDFEEGDTPLHTAIKLGEFRYTETMTMFGKFLQVKNSAGKTPLDCAMERAVLQSQPVDDIRKDYRFITQHLLTNGAKKTSAFMALAASNPIDNYRFKSPYLNRAKKVQNYTDLQLLLRDIGEDQSYCLKFKKNMAYACIKAYIAEQPDNLECVLRDLKADLQKPVKQAAELLYLHQLRTSLWIIRQFRGLFGYTSTVGNIMQLIDTTLNERVCYSLNFFTPERFLVDEVVEIKAPTK